MPVKTAMKRHPLPGARGVEKRRCRRDACMTDPEGALHARLRVWALSLAGNGLPVNDASLGLCNV